MSTTTSRRRARIVAFVAAIVIGSAALALPAGAATPGVTLTSSVNPSVSGQRVVLRVLVTDPAVPAAGITGTAAFSDGATVLGTAAVTNGRASLATTALAAGTHSITAAFSPTAGGTTLVSAPFVQTVVPAATKTTLTTSRATANYGDPGAITATVRPVAPGTGVPTGTVDFSVDGTWYWTATLDAKGKATLALADLYPSYYPGTYAITATYSGDTGYNPSATAAPLSQSIVGLSMAPTTTLTLPALGLPVFNPRVFNLSSVSPVGCNVTIINDTGTAQALAYGTPGAWKRLPFGTIPAGGSRGVGVGIGNFTGYFTTVGNLANYVTINCR